MLLRHILSGVAMCAGLLSVSISAAKADSYPKRTISFVCLFPPGNGADILVRFIARSIQTISGATIIVENKPGASGLIGTNYVVRSKPDGYTVLVHATPVISSAQAIFATPPFDPRKAVEIAAPVSVGMPFMLAVPASSPYRTLAQLTDALKQKGSRASYGFAQVTGKVMGELYKIKAGIAASEVSYKSSPDLVGDLMAGLIDFGSLDIAVALSEQRKGRIRLLASAAERRLESLPDIPTMAEQGIEMDLTGWWALMVPVGTDLQAKAKLNEWMQQVSQKADFKEFLAQFGGDPFHVSPQQAQDKLLRDVDSWNAYGKIANIVPQ